MWTQKKEKEERQKEKITLFQAVVFSLIIVLITIGLIILNTQVEIAWISMFVEHLSSPAVIIAGTIVVIKYFIKIQEKISESNNITINGFDNLRQKIDLDKEYLHYNMNYNFNRLDLDIHETLAYIKAIKTCLDGEEIEQIKENYIEAVRKRIEYDQEQIARRLKEIELEQVATNTKLDRISRTFKERKTDE